MVDMPSNQTINVIRKITLKRDSKKHKYIECINSLSSLILGIEKNQK